ncbi:phage tail sheath C-terminal domain-containing protein [Mastigocoleus sp. MO_188.B34]|uniref:phage tail sheath family protein n=1 Tax=Mastigocoleus sp. MO_188.B34 TaxID=3036635 RepID=UPI00260A13B2|nr:phage tail sheath C-terminal domain-containing protein [Mastigocoleus sp. MO_188.B34]MDJ0693217.1 phage tail sheath subtilisin-like domain-containing protein [Mastigocoleus sp. MO_188.B34]
MPEYLAPGVYVEEVPSLIKPIAPVSTSIAGFIGVVPNEPIVEEVKDQMIATGDGEKTQFKLPLGSYPVKPDAGEYEIKIGDEINPFEARLENNDETKDSFVVFQQAPQAGADIRGSYKRFFNSVVGVGEVKVCTNFTEFTKSFGEFTQDTGQNILAHAVYGFFNNGGSRCYVMRVNAENDITEQFLERTFEPIDEIAIVAAPGILESSVRAAIVTHCQQRTQDRFAIFDCPQVVETNGLLDLLKLDRDNDNNVVPDYSDYAAFYFPWIEVFDPATKTRKYVPPSGHIAGIYARVDTAIGVHKAPANEVIFGALGLKYKISKAQQTLLNPQGVNCIRDLNGNYLVWGARTIGGDANSDLKYINVRRTLLFLRESIDEGTQWVVFEPNTPNLWRRITRNVSDFLTTVWRSGALFGDTPEQAFYVKCDAETNPPEERELGRVVTEIGVAIVRPAEFVIFRISQITPQTNS